jgi:DNA-binding MarR family transcriptional regulator
MRDAADIGVPIGLAYGNFVSEMRAALAEEGFGDLHRSFGYVARLLDELEASIKELADLLGLTSQGAVKVVDEIQAHGYVRRVGDPADGRVRRVQLTERGRTALTRARAFHARFEAELAQRIGPREAAAFSSVLTPPARVDESGATASAIRPM